MARVVLAMSGGVDSSVAAWLLKQQGHDVVGLFMRHGQGPEKGPGLFCRDGPKGASHKTNQVPFPRQGCCSAADADDARRVAELLGVPFYAVNFEQEFERIVDYFVDSYLVGRTPNPCIVCNTWLKFGRLFEYADGVGAEFVATGHHARLETKKGPGLFCRNGPSGASHKTNQVPFSFPALCRGRDESKDQSYVLFGIRRELLGRLMFPVGEYGKNQIRGFAEQLGLGVAEKPDSQEICFVPPGEHARFVREQRPDRDTAGEIVATDGTVLGRHGGIEQFTIGQRKGLGVALGEPRYVVRIEPERRRVVLGTREELGRTELTAGEANWLVEQPLDPFRCQVKIRYRSRLEDATVTPLAGGRFHVRFDRPRHGIAPGQAAVCYQGDRVLGGGWIE